MITLAKNENTIVFTFEDNTHYLFDGTIEVPVNSLTLVTDNSQMATFKKSASNDIFISANYAELGMSKSELESWFKENACGSTGGCDVPSNLSEWTYDDNGNITSMVYTAATIPDNAYHYGKLTDVTIGSGVTSIGAYAFTSCRSLTSITIPDSVTSMGQFAFNGCSGLRSVTIGSGVTSIGDSAFYRCTDLTSINIPSGITNIGQQAFRYCTSLTSVTCLATTPPTMLNSVFDNTNNCPIYVPAASVDAYKAATNWSTYASRIQAIP